MELISIAIVALTLLIVLLLEKNRTPYLQWVLNWLPAILFAYIIPAIFSHAFSLDMTKVALHDISKDFIVPLAIVTVMGALSFRQLKAVGIRPILVFVSGSFAVAMFALPLLWFFGLFTDFFQKDIIDGGYWQGMVTQVGSWGLVTIWLFETFMV